MSRMSIFNSPFLLGFDQLEELLDSVSKNSGEGYPPYNIEHIGDHAIRITLAVAGFSKDDLSITLEANQLIIRGKQADDSGEKAYLHRGIAARQFVRKFVLADGMEVSDAMMEHGLLHIDLTRPEQQETIRTIKIS
ncbi:MULTISPECIES: Hsp20 family protein [Kordiimonas]|jgi:HSP20 family molecular chaperone IbpA|uniref:Molecular chaperone IbpA, HSP20 family n=1 Tax=Kordiimonas lacus TaxID=637679 RepID=A0A1G6T785_9PROT|nr:MULTISPECIES: Hsp20 family protein [Kordiimonas]SDD24255.1 Molecular chaperone IbpA, HSP20 family [Kordiimonas lacus]